MTRWEAIVFDLDDTLYPEREYVLSGFRAVAVWVESHLGIDAAMAFAGLLRLYEQGVRGDTFNRFLAQHGLADGEVVAQLVQVYRTHEPQIHPFPEVSLLLAELHSHYRLGLVSDGNLAAQRAKWAALGLGVHFDAVVFSDALGPEAWKPSHKALDAVLERLNVAAEHAVYVGDNPLKDFLAARAVGMRSLRVRRPGGEYSHLEPPTPWHAPDLTICGLGLLEQALYRLEETVGDSHVIS